MAPSTLPPSRFIETFRETNPGYRPGVNEETDALFNPSISETPLYVPMSGQIKRRLNREMEYFWALDRNGQNPYHERVEQLRFAGFDYATTKDVEMAVSSTVQGTDREGFSNEIRNGDRRLMKIPKMRWLEIRKSQQLQAIRMTNPRGKVMGEDGTVMGVSQLLPGVRTTVTDVNAPDVETIRAKSVVSDAKKDLEEGQFRGNTSVVPKESFEKKR